MPPRAASVLAPLAAALAIVIASGCAITESSPPPVEDPLPIVDDEPDQPDAPIEVFVIALQSNAVGGALVSELPPALAAYAAPHPGVQQAYQLDCPTDGVDGPCQTVQGWRDLAPRAPLGRFGIELAAGRRLDDRFGTVALIKTATSGTGVGEQWEPDAPGKWQWHYMVEYIDAKLAELPPQARIAGLMLVGCEGDASDRTAARSLDGELAYLILRFRQEFGEVPVVLAELSAPLAFRDDVRARQHRVADHIPNVTVVPTGDLAFRDGRVHYDAPSFITLGTRMADAFPAR